MFASSDWSFLFFLLFFLLAAAVCFCLHPYVGKLYQYPSSRYMYSEQALDWRLRIRMGTGATETFAR